VDDPSELAASRGRLVLVEDEDGIARPLAAALGREGFDVHRFARAEDAIDRLDWLSPDLVVLDLGLPGMSGLRACQAIRRRSTVPVMILTARGTEEDRLAGFEAGADDYVPKPFTVHELTARIRAILRRTRSASLRAGGEPIDVGGLRLNPARRQVSRAGAAVALSPREFDLLEYLMRRSPDVVTRDELIREVWDRHWDRSTKTLDVHVAQLRRKIEKHPDRPRYLHTVRSVGYRVSDGAAQ
jgi:DNA-binding response OmpR family regulator